MEIQLTFFPSQNFAKKTKPINHWNIFFDGAARNNPGPAGAGIYITYKNEVVCKQGYFLGEKTNNQAEYLAFLLALFVVTQESSQRNITLPHLIISSDSELLVKQTKGLYRVKNQELKKIKNTIDILLKTTSYNINHIPRKENTIADKLANKGINSKKNLPPDYVQFLQENGILI